MFFDVYFVLVFYYEKGNIITVYHKSFLKTLLKVGPKTQTIIKLSNNSIHTVTAITTDHHKAQINESG